MPLATLADAVIEDGGRLVTMRRSGYTPRADFQLEGRLRAQSAPFRVARYSAGGDLADYVMARYVPDADYAASLDAPVTIHLNVTADDQHDGFFSFTDVVSQAGWYWSAINRVPS